MDAAEYARRRAAGICAADSCRRPASHGTRCRKHHRMQRAASRKSSSKAYLAKKLAGICIYKGCHKPCRPDASLCHGCTEKERIRRAAYVATDKFRERHRAKQARLRAARRALGLCTRCNRPLATTLLCQVHREQEVAAWRKRTGRGPNTKERCHACDRLGHRSTSCLGLAPLPPLRIEDFASARREAA